MITFKAIAALLDYPNSEVQAAAHEILRAIVEEGALDAATLAGIKAFVDKLATSDLLELQEYWVGHFDRSKRLALQLHEHSYGESRDRGQAMVNLATTYRLHGFELACSEMPDYLPLFLEFLAQIPDDAARNYLADAIDIIEVLRIRLAERDSSYAILFQALVSLSAHAADGAEVDAILASEPEDPKNLEELDKQWAEEPVDFTPGSALKSCPLAGDIGRQRAATYTDTTSGAGA